eukprot:TRINITY_DN7554_c0_g2_i1.p1 TRINITY_DN7554_c0_g2~~TRINITY_DN7554_c0_g2_i1.p1  ORF type:complete len:287 (+),score=64.64 TRINITY_DN7554_c0_g2_i1:345-1205(+)
MRFKQLIEQMLAYDPCDRISPSEALRHPFFQTGEETVPHPQMSSLSTQQQSTFPPQHSSTSSVTSDPMIVSNYPPRSQSTGITPTTSITATPGTSSYTRQTTHTSGPTSKPPSSASSMSIPSLLSNPGPYPPATSSHPFSQPPTGSGHSTSTLAMTAPSPSSMDYTRTSASPAPTPTLINTTSPRYQGTSHTSVAKDPKDPRSPTIDNLLNTTVPSWRPSGNTPPGQLPYGAPFPAPAAAPSITAQLGYPRISPPAPRAMSSTPTNTTPPPLHMMMPPIALSPTNH